MLSLLSWMLCCLFFKFRPGVWGLARAWRVGGRSSFCKGPNPSRRSLVNPRLNIILKCEAYRSRNSADMVQREKRTQLVNAAPALCLLFPGPPRSTHWPFGACPTLSCKPAPPLNLNTKPKKAEALKPKP